MQNQLSYRAQRREASLQGFRHIRQLFLFHWTLPALRLTSTQVESLELIRTVSILGMKDRGSWLSTREPEETKRTSF